MQPGQYRVIARHDDGRSIAYSVTAWFRLEAITEARKYAIAKGSLGTGRERCCWTFSAA